MARLIRDGMKRTGALGFLSLGALVLTALPAAADDAGIKSRIEERLRKAGLDKNAAVEVDVRGGHAVLTGVTTSVHDRREAEKAARKEARAVEDRLRVFPEARSDKEIVEAVRDTILRYPYYSIYDDVAFALEDGVVRLQGSVYQPNRRSDIDDRVARVAGIKEIENEIRVQPVSIFDDQLRRQLTRAIYGDERFVQYAHRANPPIHIIVENGHVTLTGYVVSPVEQALLGHIARGTLAFGVENQVKVDGDEAKEAGQKTTRS